MDVNLIGVPIFYGSDKKGPEYAPQKLREKNIIQVIRKHNHTVYDMGNMIIPHTKEYNKFYSHPKMKYFDSIICVNTNLAHMVYCSIKGGSFPLVIGGDHSIGLGSISGVSRANKNFAVIWIDAHGDINTIETTQSGNVHGMPLSHAMGIGHPDLVNLYFKGPKIPSDNVFIVGARDLDDGERIIIQERNLNVYSSEIIHKRGIESVTDEIIKQIQKKNIDTIHVSFDIDFIDSPLVPGTGTPVSNGINIENTKTILKMLAQTKLIKSMDIVELNTLLDRNDITADLTIDLIDWIFKYI
ncbi:arginase [Inediibacterium massiliense]|uniref:arginase n=1 Tax=Inediibacterium massiliense TaxID=1658111 RepID=UPI0006B4D516|nr:arginase [Inediibacterium massiliense]